MKFSEQWLREWVNPPVDTKILGEQLTMAGLEVDSIVPAAPAFSQVIIGLIKSTVKHPDADRLRICTVDVGQAVALQIVCGAANARPDIKVAVALVGAILPGDFRIKESKIRGVESYGMLCSAKELGLAEESNGIVELLPDAPIGVALRDYLKLDDQVLEIELTPNRGDCLSIQGVAREVAAINHLGMIKFDCKESTITIQESFAVKVLEPVACPRYLGRVVRNINTAALTPLWMQERLRRGGIRSIHPVVDVLNYVMLELGQPMHAFDLNKLDTAIEIRKAHPGEEMTLLDGKKLKLVASSLIIADKKGPLALAGVMGGFDSAVTAQTHDIFLESAFFLPSSIGTEARRYGLQSDSSYRFERGVDPQLARLAMNRVSELLQQIVGGELGPIVECVSEEHLANRAPIMFKLADVKRLLGIEVEVSRIESILAALGIQLLSKDSDSWQLQVPSFRFDLKASADLIEEIARIIGYDHIPAVAEQYAAHAVVHSARELELPSVSKILVDRGYREIISYSFIDPETQQLFNPAERPIRLANPLAQDMSVMRSSLWPGLVKIAQYNSARQTDRVRIFETGLCFTATEQRLKIGGLITGHVYAEQWGEKAREVDFFDVKADLEAIFKLTKQTNAVQWQVARHSALHPGQSAELHWSGKILGYVGALHPSLVKTLELKQAPFLFELDFEALKQVKLGSYQAISKFPAVRRDLAMLVDRDLAVIRLQENIQDELAGCLNSLVIFDIYEGKNIEAGKKSVALGLIFQNTERTLVDEEINALVARIVNRLEREFKIILRQ